MTGAAETSAYPTRDAARSWAGLVLKQAPLRLRRLARERKLLQVEYAVLCARADAAARAAAAIERRRADLEHQLATIDAQLAAFPALEQAASR